MNICLVFVCALSCFSPAWLCNPMDCSPPNSSFMGFSSQEHWIFPSPMHESEKWKWSCSVVSNSSQSHGLQPTRLLCPWDFPGKGTGVGCHCLLWYSMDNTYNICWIQKDLFGLFVERVDIHLLMIKKCLNCGSCVQENKALVDFSEVSWVL